MKVRVISVTQPIIQIDGKAPTAEELMVYCARVSSPENQANLDTAPKLLNYCMKNGHWSVFEMADMTVEIETTRAISPQILRHKSFSFQEFSQRYAKCLGFEIYEPRRQDTKNRQNSIDDLPDQVKQDFIDAQQQIAEGCFELYERFLAQGVAKESARFLLPLNTKTTLYMKGSVRSWITYLMTRMDSSTQKEHRDIANAIFELFKSLFPHVAEAMEKWVLNET